MSWKVYIINFKDGTKASMITDQCPEPSDAILAAFERFGQKRILNVIENKPGTIEPKNKIDFMRI